MKDLRPLPAQPPPQQRHLGRSPHRRGGRTRTGVAKTLVRLKSKALDRRPGTATSSKERRKGGEGEREGRKFGLISAIISLRGMNSETHYGRQTDRPTHEYAPTHKFARRVACLQKYVHASPTQLVRVCVGQL